MVHVSAAPSGWVLPVVVSLLSLTNSSFHVDNTPPSVLIKLVEDSS
jgi:hypothetical protein